MIEGIWRTRSGRGSSPCFRITGELRQLWEEHLKLEKKLEELNSQAHLSPSEQTERKMIKKRKLAGKDQIARILAHPDG